MDRKSIIILVGCFLLLFSWPLLVNKIYPPKPLPPGQTNLVSTSQLTTNRTGTPVPPLPALEAPATPKSTLNTSIPEQLLEVTNTDAHYTFTSYGGGLKIVELLHYPESVSTRREQRSRTNRVTTLNTFTPDPSLAILDGEAVQGDGIFNLTQTANGVRAEKTLTNGLKLIKEFELSTNYLVLATIRLENHSEQSLSLPSQEWVVGTAT